MSWGLTWCVTLAGNMFSFHTHLAVSLQMRAGMVADLYKYKIHVIIVKF